MSGLSLRARGAIAGSAAVLLAVVAVGYTVRAHPGPAVTTSSTAEAGTTPDAGPRLRVLSNGVLSTVSLQDPGGPRTSPPSGATALSPPRTPSPACAR